MRTVWLGAVALACVFAPGLVSAQATDAAASSLAAEIAAWVERDRSVDPKATREALGELLRRVEADGTVPARARGELFAMLTVADYSIQDREGALAWLARAEAAYLEAGNAADKRAEVLHNRAALLRAMRRLDEAETAIHSAIALRRELYGDASTELASSKSTLANILYSQGRYEEAVAIAREALAAQEAAAPDDVVQIVSRLDTLASLLDESGRREEAVRIARREEELAREKLPANHQWFGLALNTLGQALLNAGLHEQAIPVILEALDWRGEHLGREHPYTAASLMILSVAYEETGRLAEAAELSAASLPILNRHRDLMDTNTVAGTYHRIARIAAAQGDWELYDRRIAEGLAEVDGMLAESSPARSFLHVFHASQLYRRGRTQEALAIAEEWVPHLQAALIPENADRILGEMLLGRLRQEAGTPHDQVMRQLDPVVQVVARKLSNLGATDRDLAREASANSAAVLLLFEAALAAGDQQRAFEALQFVTLSDLAVSQQRQAELGENETDPARRAHARLIELARLTRQIERRYALAIETGDAAQIEARRVELAGHRVEFERAEQALRTEHPDYVARYRPSPESLESFRASLAHGDVVLVPVEAQGEGWSVTITRDDGLRWSRFDSDEVARLAGSLRFALTDPFATETAYPYADAVRLYRLLLPQGAPDNGRLLFYGGQSLASLPLATLVTADYSGPLDGAPWLVRDTAVQVLGNLTSRVGGAGRSRPSGQPLRVAGIGGAALPDGERAPMQLAGLFRSGEPASDTIAGLPPLPDVARELQAIAAAWPEAETMIFVGAEAHEERLKAADFSGVQVLAFATHGLVSGELKGLWEPALLVGTAEGSGEDGLLGASEIAQLRLDADWVILSACNTAAGDEELAPLYSGLAAAFAQAGARSLMLSHWRVRDDAAARLSVSTVRGAAEGLPRAEALRRAQLALMADATLPDAAHPAIWAPFVIVEN